MGADVTGSGTAVVSAWLKLRRPSRVMRQRVGQCGSGQATSASLVIQENADSDVQADLITALHRLAPDDGPWVHTAEGSDDMPGHIKAMLAGVSLHVPVRGGKLALGTWQGIYLLEHRARPHRREVILQFVGSRG